ncbi:hypothetical protein EVAR_59819_1 [Eumeta japonica]|uniref:Uncharacterized protein n=1 Tax=Eumeta variegata TaxID=151549 RepID=A0A4C1ZEN5_EUMVA|nr:hypothetical protein EVAR_59819_1 [Eumeta japonica]
MIHHTPTESGRKVAAFAVSFRPVSERSGGPFPFSPPCINSIPSIRYPIPSQEAGNVLAGDASASSVSPPDDFKTGRNSFNPGRVAGYLCLLNFLSCRVHTVLRSFLPSRIAYVGPVIGRLWPFDPLASPFRHFSQTLLYKCVAIVNKLQKIAGISFALQRVTQMYGSIS